MVDTVSPLKRSEIMARIRGSGNKNTELALIKIFKKYHIIGWRRKQKIYGNPDFVFRDKQILVFVDGCFWHNCPKHGHIPLSNIVYWRKKIERNMARDRQVTRTLKKEGWKVLRIWEHELSAKNEKRLVVRLKRYFDIESI